MQSSAHSCAVCDANAGLGRGRMVTTTQLQKRRNWRRSLALSLQLCRAQSAALLLRGTLLQPAHTQQHCQNHNWRVTSVPILALFSAVLYSSVTVLLCNAACKAVLTGS
eukprot:15636-Heterococcus_DN1.PRE.1